MRNFTVALAFLFSFSSSFSQVEILDKIVGTIIPEIVKGVQTIKQTSGAKKKDIEATALENRLKSDLESLNKKIMVSRNNLVAINSLFDHTGDISSNLGALKILTNKEFLEAVLSSNNEAVLVRTALNFDDRLNTVKEKYSKLDRISINEVDSNLRDKIETALQNSAERISDLTNRVQREGGPSPSMGYNKAKVYVENINESATLDDIKKLEEVVDNFNILVSSWIKSVTMDFKQAESSIKNLTE